MDTRDLKDRLRKGQVVIGTWVFQFNTPGIARLLATTGADFVVYDMEHSGFGIESVRSLVAESRSIHLPALVRPPAAEYHLIAPVLDVGAAGIIAPRIKTVDEVARVVDACRYYPQGHRGAAFSIAHDDYLSGDVVSKTKKANDAVLCGVLIETKEAIDCLEEILAVPGIDLAWVGHFDLSLSMGIPGEFTHSRFAEAVKRIIRSCEQRGIPVGVMVEDPARALQSVRQGFRCLSYWGDIWLLQRALTEGIQAIRRGLSEDAPQ